MSRFCPTLTDAEYRQQLIALGLLRPRTGGPAMKRFRNAAGEPVLRLDAAGRRVAQRAQSEAEAERALFGDRREGS